MPGVCTVVRPKKVEDVQPGATVLTACSARPARISAENLARRTTLAMPPDTVVPDFTAYPSITTANVWVISVRSAYRVSQVPVVVDVTTRRITGVIH